MCLLLDAVLARVKPNWTQIIWSTIQRGGRAGGWGRQKQIKQILKSSWQLNKTAPKGCLSWLGVQAFGLPLSVFWLCSCPGFHGAFISLPAAPVGAGVITTDTKRKRQP